MLPTKEKYVICSVILLSFFLCSYSLNSGQFSSFKNYNRQESLSDDIDELGGSLLDSVDPNSNSDSSGLFDYPGSTQNDNISDISSNMDNLSSTTTDPTEIASNINPNDDSSNSVTETPQDLDNSSIEYIKIKDDQDLPSTDEKLEEETTSETQDTTEAASQATDPDTESDTLTSSASNAEQGILSTNSTTIETVNPDEKKISEDSSKQNTLIKENKNETQTEGQPARENSPEAQLITANATEASTNTNIDNSTNTNTQSSEEKSTPSNSTDSSIQNENKQETLSAAPNKTEYRNISSDETSNSNSTENKTIPQNITNEENSQIPKSIINDQQLTSESLQKIGDKKNDTPEINVLASRLKTPDKITPYINAQFPSIKKRELNSPNTVEVSTPSQSSKLHSPYTPETTNMRYISLIVLIIFGSTLLTLKLFGSFFTSLSKTFFAKGSKQLYKEMVLYFVLLIFVYVLWTFGLFDSIKINWEYTLASIGLFGLCWLVFCLILLSFSVLAANKWTELERDCLNSFVELRSSFHLDEGQDKNRKNMAYYKECLHYLILKTQFCVPFYPVFKPSILNIDFRFDIYLCLSMVNKLRLFFRFSWTSWFIVICSFLIWSIYIAPRSVQFITIFIMCYPLLGALVTLVLYMYMRHIYGKVINGAEDLVNMKYSDIESNQIDMITNSGLDPIYLMNTNKNFNNFIEPSSKFHE